MKTKVLMAGLFAAAALLAQPPGGPGRGGRMGFGPGPGFGGPMGFDMRATVTGQPFSGQEVTTEQQTLANGNVIQHQTTINIYRDSQGRVRTEETMVRPAAPGSTAAGTTTTRTIIRIFDPVAGTMSEIDPQNKVVHQTAIHMRPAGGSATNGNGGPRGRGMMRSTATQDPSVKTEDLGAQSMNGVVANGTRITHTIAAGTIGNSMPIQTVRERWFASDLQVPIMEKTTDPRFGTTVRQLTNVVRSEPDASLFQAPSGYTIEKGMGRGRWNGPHQQPGGGQIQ